MNRLPGTPSTIDNTNNNSSGIPNRHPYRLLVQITFFFLVLFALIRLVFFSSFLLWIRQIDDPGPEVTSHTPSQHIDSVEIPCTFYRHIRAFATPAGSAGALMSFLAL